MSKDLNPDKALIFRITHRDNVSWILENGLHCRNSQHSDPRYVSIGNDEIIERRRQILVRHDFGGFLSDYIPFYFTPFSPMLYNIKTGYGGIRKRENSEIVIIVSSLRIMAGKGFRFLFTDRHAALQAANFYSDLAHLNQIPWGQLQNRDFRRDPNDLEKVERYQAEALVHNHVPVDALLGIVCYDETTSANLVDSIRARNLTLKVVRRSNWYF